jgi:hypothetical protein
MKRNIQEALRIHPPLILLMRYAKEAFSVTTSGGKEVTIPKVGTGRWALGAGQLPTHHSDPLAPLPRARELRPVAPASARPLPPPLSPPRPLTHTHQP